MITHERDEGGSQVPAKLGQKLLHVSFRWLLIICPDSRDFVGYRVISLSPVRFVFVFFPLKFQMNAVFSIPKNILSLPGEQSLMFSYVDIFCYMCIWYALMNALSPVFFFFFFCKNSTICFKTSINLFTLWYLVQNSNPISIQAEIKPCLPMIFSV